MKARVLTLAVLVVAQSASAQQTPGTWMNVTDPTMVMSGWTYGPLAVVADPVRPSDLYVNVKWDGTWRSTDFGLTWTKVSRGAILDAQGGGAAVFMGIDKNPNRDPETAPTLYVALFQGPNSIWKSTNWGVDWVNIWTDNLYLADGVTKIFPGSDVGGVLVLGTEGPDHLLAYLHGMWDPDHLHDDWNGVFESTDGGGKWIVHTSPLFHFTVHGDTLMAYDHDTWMVSHPPYIYRTVNRGGAWAEVSCPGCPTIGRNYLTVASRIYAGSDFGGPLFKSPDKGATWQQNSLPSTTISWVVATPTRLYASSGRVDPHIYVASLADDTTWVDTGNPPGMTAGGANAPAVVFDGSNYILIAPQETGGLWRYVEPDNGEIPPAIVDDPPVEVPPVDDPSNGDVDDPAADDGGGSGSSAAEESSNPPGSQVHGTCASMTAPEGALVGLGVCVLLLRRTRRRDSRS